ncbi:MAG: glycosyltransferase family 2 protein, partial [Thermodesulfobacteriota bacterium]
MILLRPKHQTLEPSDEDLRQWTQSEWPEYREWLERKSIQTRRDWMQQRGISRKWKKKPIFSLITPVFDTDPGYLLECVLSLLVQSYEHWELCLVDDGSTRMETLEVLDWAKKRDRRIRVCTLQSNQGICAASNVAVKMAKGEFAAFLDHDDRLASEAMFHLARAVREQPHIDLWYTDRDMISARNLKYMHLLKPSWSPETILSGNYCFHLMAYRLSFLRSLGGLRPDFEGSQDYDLILRAAEHTEKIAHLPRVLYHWRQAERSLALDDTSKEYTFSAGLQAVHESLSRRNIQAEVNEDPDLWRGHYRIRFLGGPDEEVRIVRVPMHKDPSGYAQEVLEALQKALDHGAHVAILGQGLEYPDESLNELNAWLVIPKVKLTTGKMVDSSSHIIHSGLVLR